MPTTDLIFDVGMNNGDDTVFYLALGYRVVAIEADPTLVDHVRSRCRAAIESGHLRILCVGIAEEEGVLPFWVCEGKSEWSSFDKASASRHGRSCHAIEIPCVRFGTILEEHGVPHYLKIDIEMSDAICLRDIDPGNAPDYVSLELTDPATLGRLRELGYDRFKVIVQNDHLAMRTGPRRWFPALRRRLPIYRRSLRARLGLPVYTQETTLVSRDTAVTTLRWRFPYGSSGPFGEQSDGEWLDFEAATRLFDEFRAGRTELGPPGHLIWQDVHASRGGLP